MTSSGRFAIATHALALLASSGACWSSEQVAESINTHPVFLRRLMASLSRAGFVTAREGRGGGYRLARPAGEITLRDVFEAVEPEGAIAPSPCDAAASCPVGAGMGRAFAEVTTAANEGLLGALERRTVADVAARARRLGKPAKHT